MSRSYKIHRKLTDIIAEMKRIEKTLGENETNQRYFDLLAEQSERLQKQYRKMNGFNYNPLMYSGRELSA